MTIRARLTLFYVGAIIVAAAVVTALVWWQVGAALRASMDQTLDAQATATAATLENNGQAGLQETNATGTSRVFLAVFSVSGQLLDSTSSMPNGFALPGASVSSGTVTLGNTTYAFRVASADPSIRVVAGASLTSLIATQDQVARSLLLVGGLVALLSLLGGWWLAGRALRPVALITAEARQISAADLARRVPVPVQKDELHALATTLNDMLERVAESSQRQRAFVAAASHDLRTPIAALQAELELAVDTRTTTDELRTAVRSAHADIVRLGELAAGLLNLAAMDFDGRTLVRTPTRIDDLLESVVRRAEPAARERGTSLVPAAPAGIARVDRVRLEQALTNLVLNAIAYGPPGSVVEIAARFEASGPTAMGAADAHPQTLLIDVLDRGPGIDAELAGHLFDPFTRGRHPATAGTGLGLATAATAIRAHHGTIGFDPRPDGGTRFWIRVPA